jgi:DNA invertase Pin-like site-specific DNA recombinase
MMSTTKAYSYLRFSTTRQVRGDSARRQLELARDYAKIKGLELQELALADMGVSAFKGANRDAALGVFLRLVQDGKIPKGAYLLVESHDRLSRQNVEDALLQFMEIIRAGIVVVTLTDEIEYRQGQLDMSKLMLSLVYMSRANEESEMKSRRAKAVWEQSRKAAVESKTLIRNAYLPQWLKWEGDRVAIIPERAAIVQRMFALAMQGYGYTRIAAILNNEGHTEFRKNNPWRPSGVGSLLRNRRVIGEYQNCTKVDGQRQPIGEPIPEYYPAIVSISDFQEVQQQIATRK